MATAPVRSQPLHNFSLPCLKWGSNLPRKLLDSSSSQQQQQQQESSLQVDHNSSSSEAINGFEKQHQQSRLENRKSSIPSRCCKNRSSPLYSSSLVSQKKNTISSESEIGVNEFKYGVRNHPPIKDEAMERGGDGVGEVGESMQKPWKLRPRRSFKTQTEINGGGEGGGAPKSSEVQEKQENLPKSLRLRGFLEGQNVETKEKRKVWISLSREEIEDDFFKMIGSKPPRRPKKRSKIVQKQLDNVFPGLWLVGTSADSFAVPDAPAKR